MPHVKSDPSGLYRAIMWSSYEYLLSLSSKISLSFYLWKHCLGCWLLWAKSFSEPFSTMWYIILLLSYLIFSWKYRLYFTSIKILLMKWSRLLCVSDLSSFFTTPAVCMSFANLLQVVFTVYSRSLIFKIECKARFVEKGDKFLLHQWHGYRVGKSKQTDHWISVPFIPEPLKHWVRWQTAIFLAESLLILYLEIIIMIF